MMPPVDPPDLRDTYTKAGATRLADTIRAHWEQRGHKVAVEAYEIGERDHGSKDARKAARCYGVRSNLVDGLPRADGRGGSLRGPVAGKRKLMPRIQERQEETV